MRILILLSLIIVLSFAAFAQTNESNPLAKNFTATTIGGEQIELAKLKGKVVLMTFWTTRCAICAATVPKLNQLAAEYKNEDVVFLGLTTDNEAKVADYLKRKSFDFTLIPNSFGIFLDYADKNAQGNITMGYPAHFLINREGEIELRASGFSNTDFLDAEIRRLLKSK